MLKCFPPLWSVPLLRQHSSSSLVVSLHTHTPTHTLCKTTTLVAVSSLNQLTKKQQTDRFILHSTWCTLLCNAYPSISLCRAFASAAFKTHLRAIGGNFAALLQPSAYWINSQLTLEPREFLNHVSGSSGFFCCQENNTQDWLSLFFCCVGLSCREIVRLWVSCFADGHNCPSTACLSVCLYGRW